ncbi:metal ABC transporter solute-binding protein, Zn/Mn family [Aquirhabdus sp.]|uniref:metal ABC transporter solute-binding protein, Zn/Mn family n=1 Tax=Aquirhabdus sp. TaxID=2824160 RepID=UPI00396C8BA7
MQLFHRLFLSIVATLLLGLQCAHAGTLVATTHPLYLIAQAVTQGIEQPVALLPPASSGHDVNLRPSDRLVLKQSDFVVWFGRDYEASLKDILEHQRNAVALYDLKAFHRLPLRDVQGQPIKDSFDPHIWLDPANAIGIAYAIATVRAKQFPDKSRLYLQNAQKFSAHLLAVAHAEQANPPRHYWAYHDAYQYVEHTLNLKFAGALTADAELPPSGGQLIWLSQHRPSTMAVCLFAERTPAAALVQKLSPVQSYPIDEVMAGATNFVDGWQAIAQQFKKCTP